MTLAARGRCGRRAGAGRRRRPSRRRRRSCSACSATAPGRRRSSGVFLCPGYHDYIALREQQGRGRGLQDQACSRSTTSTRCRPPWRRTSASRRKARCWIGLYGTPQTAGADQEARGGQDPRHLAGLRHRRRRRRQALPLHLPDRGQLLVAGRRRAVAFVKKELGGSLKGKKIAYLFYDNPAGKEPLPILEDLAKSEGFELRTFAVPPPGVEMGAQVLDITSASSPTS